MKPDFSGYASKADLLCSDGRTIKPHAFKDNHGEEVPLIWNHFRDDPLNVLGHAVLEDREDGTYVYGFFNDTERGQHMKKSVKNGDINALSIFANKLIHKGTDVVKGAIQEVSLVMKGANPGASIQNVSIAHSSGYSTESDDEAIIYTGLTLEHADSEGDDVADSENNEEKPKKTLGDILETLNEEQSNAVGYLIEQALEADPDELLDDEDDESSDSDKNNVEHADNASEENANESSSDDGDDEDESEDTDTDNTDNTNDEINHSQEENMTKTHNVFENGDSPKLGSTLTHSQVADILSGAKKSGSLKESFLEHAATYGFENIDILFPDAKTIDSQPELLARKMEWVQKLIGGVRHIPFTRIKTIVADITAEEARARGYVKGNLKKEEIVKLLKRKTGPTTIYKKQKLDRDDLLDITDLDVVAWLKAEMRIMLDEEIARAVLVGDGRSAISDDKIDEDSIRPVAADDDMYAHHVTLPSNSSVEAKMEAMIRARSAYRGSGTPILWTTLGFVTDMLLLRDKMGRRLYKNLDEVASELLAKEIVTVEVMEEYPTIAGIYLNPADYSIGTDKGGNVSFFDDFDIDYNQHKYLLETRMSGALTKPKSAIVLHLEEGTEATPVSPSFDGETNTITIPTTTGVVYKIDGEVVTGDVVITEDTEVEASAAEDYYIKPGVVTSWTFTFTDQG